MKKMLMIMLFALISFVPFSTSAQGMMNQQATSSAADHTAQEEAEGKIVFDKLQSKELACNVLTDEQFATLGEYHMGQMVGTAHPAMNTMMTQMHGEDGEEQIHIIMGKRLSGCDIAAVFPTGSSGWMPMMNMMWGGWSSPISTNGGRSMMNFGNGAFGTFGWIFMILWWVLIIAGIVALVKSLTNQSNSTRGNGKTALEILRERYAKGEIDQQEFEDKKKALEA